MARKKKRSAERGSGGSGRWMTTFSDLMMLLLTFFVLLYSFSSIDAEKFERAAAALHAVLSGNPSTVIFEEDSYSGEEIPVDEPVPAPSEEIEEHTDWELQEEIMEMYEEIRDQVEGFGLQADVQVSMTGRGVLININDAVLFDTAQAEIKPEGRELLSDLGKLLQEIEHEVEIIGHTDDRPINTSQYPSNWELSVARATEVVHYLIDEAQIDPGRLKASGYGEFRPVVPNNSQESMALNRRVNMLVIVDEEVGGYLGRAD